MRLDQSTLIAAADLGSRRTSLVPVPLAFSISKAHRCSALLVIVGILAGLSVSYIVLSGLAWLTLAPALQIGLADGELVLGYHTHKRAAR